ncbi:MAG: hypothetical protein R6V77_02270 [Candidatus Cloacimonadaceae bacterium]
MKQALILFLMFVPLWLMAQDMPFTVKSSTRYSVSGMVGYEKVDSVKYYQFRLIQEFKYWKIGMGLDLDFLFDKHAHLKKDDWDNLDDILSKIYYLRYGEVEEPFYFHLGGFPNRSMVNGLVMLNYSNMLLYPELHNTGVMIGGSPKWPLKPVFEIYTSNIRKNQILSFSTHIQPLPDSTLRNIDETVIGFSFVTDRDQKSNLRYVMDDALYEQLYDELNINKSSSASVFSLDYKMPVFQSDKVRFGHYAEVAHILDYGTGFILPGVWADFNFLKVNLEYRIYGSQFVPAFFDHYYEEDRAILVEDTTEGVTYSILTKEEALADVKAAYGWYGKVQGLIGKKLKTMVAWQDMYGKDLKTGKSLWFRLWVDTQYKRLENVAFSYSKINVEELALGKVVVPKANMSLSMTFSLNEKRRWFIIGKYSERYKEKEGGINWWEDTKRSAAIGVKYTF